jgi:hypothetical protein
MRAGIGQRFEKRRQERVELGSNRARRIVFLAEQPRRHHDVRIHRPKRRLYILRRTHPALFGAALGILVADHKARLGLGAKTLDGVIRRAAQDKTNAALPQTDGNLAKAFDHELIVAIIGVVRVAAHAEKDHRGFAQCVCRLDGDVQRRIIAGALRPLHPIDDTISLGLEQHVIADRDPRILCGVFLPVHFCVRGTQICTVHT